MDINDITISVTGYRYDELIKTIPEDTHTSQVVRVYEKIINESLSNINTSLKPSFVNVSGIPGSGKSTFCRRLLESPQYFGSVYIGFDKIMEDNRLPYVCEDKNNPKEAFKRWELSARIAGYELLKRTIENKFSVILDHSSAVQQHLELFKFLLEMEYEVHFIYIAIDEDEAQRRVANRKRHVPPLYIKERSSILRELLPQYEKICTTYKHIEQCELDSL